MDIFLGFAPYVAFFVVLRMGTVEAAMWAAFAVPALVALYGRWRGRSAKILEIGGVALFGLLALFTAVSHWEWTLTVVRLAVDLGLLAIVLVSIAVGRPFTTQYARERIAEQYWQTPLFLAVNRRITWVWAAAFAVLVAAHVATVFFSVPAWLDGVVTVAAFVYATAFTARYPEKGAQGGRAATRGVMLPLGMRLFSERGDNLWSIRRRGCARSVLAPLTCTSRKTFLQPAFINCRSCASTLSLLPPGDTRA